jgi:tyrosyl-tRNA synthetase
LIFNIFKAEHLSQALQRSATAFRTTGSENLRDAASLINAFKGDPRLIFCSKDELISLPVMKLASKYGLVSSTCEITQFEPLALIN